MARSLLKTFWQGTKVNVIQSLGYFGAMPQSSIGLTQKNRIDVAGTDAPELVAFGEYQIGVRTVEVVTKNRIDVLNTPIK